MKRNDDNKIPQYKNNRNSIWFSWGVQPWQAVYVSATWLGSVSLIDLCEISNPEKKHLTMSYVTLLLVINLLVYPLHLDGQRKKPRYGTRKKLWYNPQNFEGCTITLRGLYHIMVYAQFWRKTMKFLPLGSDLCSQHLIVHLYFKPLG